VGKASSSKKVARLAQKGKGRKVRFQGGTLFPALVVGLAVAGTALIIYSRESIPNLNTPPTVEDHWHASYGFYACDEWLPNLAGNKEEQSTDGQLVNNKFRRTGIHSHEDGVIHWHPFSSESTGRNAKFGVFLDVYGIRAQRSTKRALRSAPTRMGSPLTENSLSTLSMPTTRRLISPPTSRISQMCVSSKMAWLSPSSLPQQARIPDFHHRLPRCLN
jgi:hypothetical protein